MNLGVVVFKDGYRPKNGYFWYYYGLMGYEGGSGMGKGDKQPSKRPVDPDKWSGRLPRILERDIQAENREFAG